MKSKNSKQMLLPFMTEEPIEVPVKAHQSVTSLALMAVTIQRAVAKAHPPMRGLNPQVSLFASGLPHEQLRDKWWAIEDLMIRTASEFPMSMDRDVGMQITIHGALQPLTKQESEIQTALMSPDTFEAVIDGRKWSFVRWVERRGDDLVVQFIEPGRISAWVASSDDEHSFSRLLQFVCKR